MTPREAFRRLMAYEPVKRLPVLALEPFEATAIARWRTQGLPADADPVDYLGMSRLVHVPVDFGPRPAYVEEVLAEDEEYRLRRTYLGAVVRERKDNPTLFYGHVDHPVKTRADWEAYRERFRADTPGRLPADWKTTLLPALQASPDPVGLCFFPAPFRLCFYAMGMERFLTAFHDDPALLHEIMAHWFAFAADCVRPLLGRVRLDYALIAEDLAGKNGPLVSPRVYEEFWRPYQEPLLRLLRDHGVPVLCQWSAGGFRQLLPGMLAQGFNCAWPLEQMAGMDAGDLRRDFGSELRLGGNIAKEAVIAGPAAIDAELRRLQPVLAQGGFLPALDDMASPDMPWDHYRYLIERLQGL